MNKITTKKTVPKSRLIPKNKGEDYRKVYYPYIIVIAITVVSLLMTPLFSTQRSTRFQLTDTDESVLSYATSISQSDLLSLTNSRRLSAGAPTLTLNSKLNSAAQSKANDMVARNYWSHITPDGQAPWVFITNAGYSYTKAAENLASGFATSSEVIQGWMDSTAHRTAMLSTEYKEVGFGYANSPNFTDQGESTVVVAMYATPYQAPAPAPSPAPAPAPTQSTTPTTVTPNTPSTKPSTTPTQNTTPNNPTPTQVEPTTVPSSSSPTTDDAKSNTDNSAQAEQNTQPTKNHNVPFTTESASTLLSKDINKIDQIFKKYAPYVGSILIITTLSIGLFWLYKHSKAFHKKVIQGEKYVLTHKYVDVLFIALIVSLVYLFQRVGTVL